MQDIVCAICGRRTALAPGTAMACPSCGAPISAPKPAMEDDDSSTRPSIFPLPAVIETSGISTPTSVNQDAEGSNTDAATTDPPRSSEPEHTWTIPSGAMPTTDSQTQPVQPIEPPAAWPDAPASASEEPPIEPPAPARKRNPFALISALVLVLLLLVVGAAAILLANGRLPFFSATPTPTATATATPAPTATAPSVLTTFTDGGNVFSIGYPSAWLLTAKNAPGDQPRLAIFSNPLTNANFNVGTLSTTDTPAQQIADQTLAVLAQKSGIANRSGPTQIFIAGQMWVQESGDVAVDVKGKSIPMHATALATIHGSHTIYILLLAPVDTYATIEPTFQQMLQSFQFLP